MSGPVCSRCGEPFQWRRTPAGKMAPYNLEPGLHIITCKQRPKPNGTGPRAEAVAALRALGYKATEAREMVKAARGKDVEALLRDVLARKGTE